jgi:hypothetical protein
MLDFLSGQNLGCFANRDEKHLLIAADIIVIIAVQPEYVETDVVTDTGNGADVQQVQFGSTAFCIITELAYQGIFPEKEPLRLTVPLVEGLD